MASTHREKLPPNANLGRFMRSRRHELGQMTIGEAARAAGLSPTTWINVEHGRPSRGRTYAAVEAALGWLPGSCADVEDGGVPVVDPEFSLEPEQDSQTGEKLVIVDLSAPGQGIVVLAAGGESGISETTRRAMLAMASDALDAARRRVSDDTSGLRAHG